MFIIPENVNAISFQQSAPLLARCTLIEKLDALLKPIIFPAALALDQWLSSYILLIQDGIAGANCIKLNSLSKEFGCYL